MSETLVVTAIGLALALAVIIPFTLRIRQKEKAGEEAEEKALRYGLHEPVTLYPIVDPERCMGSAACVQVCPEGVLAVRNGQGVAVAPAKCIGHGLCESACPTEAIRLVFGTAQRGVDIPRVRENFETNVPGIYIVGELGGMGLIRNAFEQGRQCVEAIAKENRPSANKDALDVLIVGCGPAGLSASLNSMHRGLRFRTIEKEDVGGTVRHYPRKKLVMTSSVKVPGYGKLDFREVHKEKLIDVWEDIAQKTGLEVNTGETVAAVRPTAGGFEVITDRDAYLTQRVILAIGRRGVPRKLDVPGEDSANVAYSLREPEAYQGDRIVVVGGGDSAVEAALALSEQPGNTVRLSYRGEKFARIKQGNRDRIEAAAAKGSVHLLMSTNVTGIGPDWISWRNGSETENRIENDRVFIFVGGELPTRFLRECGVEVVTKFGTA